MKYIRIIILVAASGALFHNSAWCTDNKIVWIELENTVSGDMGKLISASGYSGKNITNEIESGKFTFREANILIFSSYCTKNPAVASLFENEIESLQSFIRRGGVVIVFTQNTQNRQVESWLIPGMALLRGSQKYNSMGFVERTHPIFSYPHAISHRRINKDWSTSSFAKQPFRLVSRGWVLAAQDKKGKNPCCVEYGWGKGRVIFFACQPETQSYYPEETKQLAFNLMENTLNYACKVSGGRPEPLPDHAIVVEKKSGYQPRTVGDSPKSNFSFETEINEATDRGIAFLLSEQMQSGVWRPFHNARHELGATSLCVVALLCCGVNKHKQGIKDAVDYILSAKPDRYEYDSYTYDISLAMMAIDSFAAPMYERFEMEKLPPEKREAFKFQRNLSEKERLFMSSCLNWLVTNQNKNNSYWTYTTPKRKNSGDLSNTQFAILGLRSAVRCGLKPQKDTWTSIINALIKAQSPNGPKVSLPEFRCYENQNGSSKYANDMARPKFYIVPAEARSWGYVPRIEGNGGSRCAMGISSLLIAHEGLYLTSKSSASKFSQKVRKAVKDGIAFLWTNWSVTENPNMGSAHHNYYLYALERLGMLTGKPYIGNRNWYREGAVFLLGDQMENGSWNNSIIHTSFALMFLKRSTPPSVITTSIK